MIYYNNRQIGEILLSGTIPIIAVYYKQLNRDIVQVWPDKDITPIDIILSCFYNGYWNDQYPWTDDTPWIKE